MVGPRVPEAVGVPATIAGHHLVLISDVRDQARQNVDGIDGLGARRGWNGSVIVRNPFVTSVMNAR
jgi:hypothetical protein